MTSTSAEMPTRRIGDVWVSAIGLGAMPLSRREPLDESRAIATVHAALDAQITFIDTADVYNPDDGPFGHNELLVAKALADYPDQEVAGQVLVATKGGMTRDGAAWGIDGNPGRFRQAAEDSARRLGVEAIGLYQWHRPDPEIPYADTLGAFAELVQSGLVQRVGISNASPDQILQAHQILGANLVSVQNEFSPSFLSSRPELDLCAELGLAFLPWSPLGGMNAAGGLGGDHRAFAEVAAQHGVSAQQVAIAWELAQGEQVIPIPGASRPASIRDTVQAVRLELSETELARLDGQE